MVAKCEVNEIGKGWVMVVEQDHKKQQTEGDKVAAFPNKLGDGENIIYYTEDVPNSLAHVIGDGRGKGCVVNGKRLEVGESVVIGNLEITGA
jgi:hypothetical protein